jgi:hypothetical protein
MIDKTRVMTFGSFVITVSALVVIVGASVMTVDVFFMMVGALVLTVNASVKIRTKNLLTTIIKSGLRSIFSVIY